MIRQFYLENKYGIRWGLNDPSTGLFVSPEGLGYKRNSSYSEIGYTFVQNYMKEERQNISGKIVFGTNQPYIACNKFINFVNTSDSFRLIYKTDVGEYYRDVDLVEFGKTEIAVSGALECDVSFTCKGLFYSDKINHFVISRTDGEMRWNFTWPARFNDYGSRKITINNNGHVPASFALELYGYCENPTIALLVNGIEKKKVRFPIVLEEDEKILYSTVDGNLYCIYVDANGTETNLSDLLDINQDNFFKLPLGDVQLQFASDTTATNKTIMTIYKFYRAV